jgi:imidazole glycerol-phosphate synthase subunit HisH
VIALVDYGMGNIRSVRNALITVGAEVHVTSSPDGLDSAAGIIVPGVGAFSDGMANLRKSGMADGLQREVREKGKPYLGICLGMQFLAESSLEGGEWKGLGFIEGKVERLTPSGPDKDRFKVPHMGWNDMQITLDCPIFQGLQSPVFYFVHSYHFKAGRQTVAGTCYHAEEVIAAVWRENIFGVQFHPEKSQGMGLKVLENFCSLAEKRNA